MTAHRRAGPAAVSGAAAGTVALAGFLVGCTVPKPAPLTPTPAVTSTAPGPTPTTTARPSPTASRSITRYPQIPAALSCTAAEVRTAAAAFVGGFNAGDRDALDRMLAAQGQGYQGYFVQGQGGVPDNAAHRDTILAYLARRHTRHETLRLTSFTYDGNEIVGSFQFTAIRRADDVPPTREDGTGVAFCNPRPVTIAGWTMDPPGP